MRLLLALVLAGGSALLAVIGLMTLDARKRARRHPDPPRPSRWHESGEVVI